VGEPVDETARVLLIQLRRIGDVLLATPLLRALKSARPGIHLAMLVEEPFAAVLRHNPHLDELIVTRRKLTFVESVALVRRLRAGRFDVCIDFLGKPGSALKARLSGAHRRIGYAARGRGLFYTDSISPGDPRAYTARHKAALLAPLGIGVTDMRLDFPVGDDDRAAAAARLRACGVADDARLVAVAPGTRREDKCWPADRFAAVTDRLVERHGLAPVFVCGPGEEPQVEAVRAAMKHPARFNPERPPLPQVQALLERCALYVGNDTGLRHMAVAAGIPSVAVFGQPRACNWTPPDDPRHRSLDFDPGCKAACTFPACGRECLTGISVEDVYGAAEEVIG
jgi:ADP-heptose:LPS heptosyltransferase